MYSYLLFTVNLIKLSYYIKMFKVEEMGEQHHNI